MIYYDIFYSMEWFRKPLKSHWVQKKNVLPLQFRKKKKKLVLRFTNDKIDYLLTFSQRQSLLLLLINKL